MSRGNKTERNHLQNHALLVLRFRSRARIEDGTGLKQLAAGNLETTQVEWWLHIPDRFVEHTLQVALRESRTLEVLVCTDLLGDGQRLLIRYGLHFACAQGVCGRSVISQIQLGSDKDDRDVGSMVLDFRVPLR